MRIGNQTVKPDMLDMRRYRKVRWFFAKTLLRLVWWDVILNRPVLRLLRTPPLPRWRKITRHYRVLAVEMGGVLIKLGQFLSIRMDILPTAVTSELAGLQDEIPPEKTEAVTAQLEADFSRPLTELFAWFSPQPVGAASLAQAHLARLPTGQEVVVKILRPGIDVLVETDLAAVALVIRWLKLFPYIARRVDLEWLAEEFTTVTRNELDLAAEGRNAERFAADFAADPRVHIPKVYWEQSSPRSLTLENVGYIKIGDLAAIDAAGIDRAQVAKTFYDMFMRQVFETNFVHADPHPGNVFVRPLPLPDEEAAGVRFAPGDPVPRRPGRPFQVVFIDFGMVTGIPERLRASIREYAIAVGTRDAHRLVQAYVSAGVLLPGADLKRLEEIHEALFERFWGVRIGKISDVAIAETRFFLREFHDIIQEVPFQFHADVLFLVRAVGILAGMATNLHPDFDPWAETIPYAERLAREEARRSWPEALQELLDMGRTALKLPLELDKVLALAKRGGLTVQTSLAPDSRKVFHRVEQSVNRLAWMVAAAALLLAGVQLHVGAHGDGMGTGLMLSAALAFLWGILKR